MMDNRKPFIYKTTDFGATWTNITGDLPATHPLDYVMAVAENPNQGNVVRRARDTPSTTRSTTARTGRISTKGCRTRRCRGSSSRSSGTTSSSRRTGAASTFCATSRRWRASRRRSPLRRRIALSAASGISTGAQRPRRHHVRSAKASPRPARVEILDSANKVVRTLQSPTRAGFNRVTWDLRYDPPRVVALRTPAPDNPHIFEEPRFNNRPTRPITHWGIQGAQTAGPLALPGKYTVRLTVNGATLTSKPFTILKDPEIKTATPTSSRRTRRAGPRARRPECERRHDQPARGDAQADPRSAKGERREAGRRPRARRARCRK